MESGIMVSGGMMNNLEVPSAEREDADDSGAGVGGLAPDISWRLADGSITVVRPYRDAFLPERIASYSDILAMPSDSLREERRTSLRRIVLKRDDGEARDCMLKVYRYPNVTGARTLWATSKAEREFGALWICNATGAPVVEPVACGTQRNAAGFVRSCFVITECVHDYVPLWTWLGENAPLSALHAEMLSELLCECGMVMADAHADRFFLFTLTAKNILVRPGSDGTLDWRFLDLPYARRLRVNQVARWAQRRDFGALAGPIYRFAGESAFEAFYGTYLPDPLGGAEQSVRRRVSEGARIYNKQTRFTRTVKCLKGMFR